jgi:hypothetical protein
MALWINTFVARETESAYGVAPCERGTFDVASNRFLWIPKGKVVESSETVLRDREIQMHNESVVRVATPMSFLVDAEFLAKVKADQFAFC